MSETSKHECIDRDHLLIRTKNDIQKFGLHVVMVGATDYLPSFAYSIGLYNTYKHPELICFGLPDSLGHAIINDVAAIIKDGETIESHKNYNNIFKNSRAEFLPVDERNIRDYFGGAINFYGSTNFPALQLVWTDRNNKFPWEESFDEGFLYDQPLLDRNAEFKFREAKNLAVFTTRQWLELDKPIVRVVHDNEGDWQFLTGDQMPDDIRVVAIEQMIVKDRTLNEVFNLYYGQSADRKFAGGEWIRTTLETSEE